MQTDHLATFVAVVDLGSISEAARRLHYSQSTVSGHVQALERFLGVALLHRTRDGVALTMQGARLYGYARSVCLLIVDARDAVSPRTGTAGRDGPIVAVPPSDSSMVEVLQASGTPGRGSVGASSGR